MDLYDIASFVRLQEIRRLAALPYPEYLQTDWWKGRRDKALHRARERCELCHGTAHPLEVHHTTYERRGRENPDDLVVLCRRCHQHVEDNGLGRVPRHELLRSRREFLHSPEFQRAKHERLDY